MSFSLIFSEYEVKLQALSGVREELEKVSSDKSFLQKELSNLEGKYKVMETLRDSQETELQTLKVKCLLLTCSWYWLGFSGAIFAPIDPFNKLENTRLLEPSWDQCRKLLTVHFSLCCR